MVDAQHAARAVLSERHEAHIVIVVAELLFLRVGIRRAGHEGGGVSQYGVAPSDQHIGGIARCHHMVC